MGFTLLQQRAVYDILIGDTPVYENHKMPYHSGQDLCDMSTNFGLPITYTWGGSNKSRWKYMEDLLQYMEKEGRTADLLAYLFELERFKHLNSTGTQDEIRTTYENIVNGAIAKINDVLLFSGVKLQLIHKRFVLLKTDESVVVEAPNVKNIDYQYIRELPDRIKEDISKKDYDSVVTKSRTLLEEVMIFVIEKVTKKDYESRGNLLKIYEDVKSLLNMTQTREWDKRINDLISGINKIVDAISSMRNMNSDAHGAGAKRVTIKEREARLIAASSVMVSEYLLSTYISRISSVIYRKS